MKAYWRRRSERIRETAGSVGDAIVSLISGSDPQIDFDD